MFVFIDDSGDAGVKFNRGSSTHLVFAACVFPNEEALRGVYERMILMPDYLQGGLREFKHAKMKEKHREKFFEHLVDETFYVRAIIIDKRILTSDFLKANGTEMKAYFIKQLLTHTYGKVQDATVVIDGADLRAFGGNTTTEYLLDHVNRGSTTVARQIVCRDSKEELGLQLADMVAGTIMACFQEKINISISKRLSHVRSRAYQPNGNWWVWK